MFYPRFFRIYKRMREKKIKVGELASLIGMAPHSLSKRLNGVIAWNIDEAYAVLDVLEVDRREITKYFPAKDIEVVITPEELEAFKC